MAAYVISEIETTDAHAMQHYRESMPPSVATYGGRFIVRGGAVQALEGDWVPKRIVVIEFENAEQARW